MRCIKCNKGDLTKEDFHPDSTRGFMETCKTCTNTARAAKIKRKHYYPKNCYNPHEFRNEKMFIG